ncbi:MAG: MIP family channel protein [Anaerolineales bacterium]|nr:MAG: MIP family channel protein [Anaerolineales bacterium]
MQTFSWRSVLAEFIGTFSLVTVGCGAIVVESQTGSLTHGGVALAFGMVVMVMISATGHISGAHLNPAVTLAFTFTRHFPLRWVGGYLAAQFAGAVAGSTVLGILFGFDTQLGVTQPSGSLAQSFLLEVLLTAALMFVITAVATDTKAVGQLAAIMIGATVMVNALWGGSISGASMNPARSFGPALINGNWEYQWLYLVAPIVGAVLGALAYQLIREPSEKGHIQENKI